MMNFFRKYQVHIMVMIVAIFIIPIIFNFGQGIFHVSGFYQFGILRVIVDGPDVGHTKSLPWRVST